MRASGPPDPPRAVTATLAYVFARRLIAAVAEATSLHAIPTWCGVACVSAPVVLVAVATVVHMMVMIVLLDERNARL